MNLLWAVQQMVTKLRPWSKTLRTTCFGNSIPVRQTFPHWLRAQRAFLRLRKTGLERRMHDGVEIADSLRRELTYLLTCGRHSLISGTQNDIVVSWIALWGMIKVYWLDFSLHLGSGCLFAPLPQVQPRAGISQPVRKWSIVCQTVSTMFSEPKVCSSSVKKRSIVVKLSKVCLVN